MTSSNKFLGIKIDAKKHLFSFGLSRQNVGVNQIFGKGKCTRAFKKRELDPFLAMCFFALLRFSSLLALERERSDYLPARPIGRDRTQKSVLHGAR